MQKIIAVPLGPDGLKNNLFLKGSTMGDFTNFFASRGFVLKTVDMISEPPQDEDVLVVFNHPDDYFWKRILYFIKGGVTGRKKFPIGHGQLHELLDTFKTKILFQMEPAIVTPYPYNNLERLEGYYTKIFSTWDLKNSKYGHVFWSYDFRHDYEKYFSVPKTKFLTLINSNAIPHGFFDKELYSERMRAVEYFGKYNDFDFYGNRWHRPPMKLSWWLPYFRIRKYWRGSIPGKKFSVFSQYKFTILFENSIFPGYIDIKLLHCFAAGVIPIYLGAPDVLDYIPQEAFIDMRNFKDYDSLNSFLRALSDEDLKNYRKAMSDFLHSKKYRIFMPEALAEKIASAVEELSFL